MNNPTPEQVRELRESTGLSQAAFSEAYGMTKRTIQNWEQGKSPMAYYVYALLKYRLSSDRVATEEDTEGIIYRKDAINVLLSIYHNGNEDNEAVQQAMENLAMIRPASWWHNTIAGTYPKPVKKGTPLNKASYVYARITEAGEKKGFLCNPESALIWDGHLWWTNVVTAGGQAKMPFETVCSLLPDNIHVDAWTYPPEELYYEEGGEDE